MIQKEALTILKTGANVFLTGEPGSGKTHTVNAYVSYLRSHGIEPSITASTGIAATHIGGMTVHSWSGIGISEKLTSEDLTMITGRKKVRKRVAEATVLIIDEVSMLSGPTLAMVDIVCRKIRERGQPFGGMQVVLVGDFFQLPPISRNGAKVSFAYESDVWKRLNPEVCYLSEQYRQDDPVFLSVLSAIRQNVCEDSHRDFVFARLCQNKSLPENVPKLFPHNADVDRINTEKLAKLSGKLFSFPMETTGPDQLVEFLKKSCLSPEILELKIGASVMFTKNSQEGRFVNGTLGTILGFDSGSGYPIVRTFDGRKIFAEPMEWTIEVGGRTHARVAQIPLRLAWAITVHKSQGMSMDAAVVDLSNAFEYGQGYVALSRVRRLSGLYLLGANDRAFMVHPGVSAEDIRFRNQSEKITKAFREMTEKDLHSAETNFIRMSGGNVQATENISSVPRGSTYDMTRQLVSKKLSLEQIVRERNLTLGTIVSHLEKLTREKVINPGFDLAHLKPEQKRFEKIKTAFDAVSAKEKKMLLSPAREILGEDFSFEELRLARLFL
jgi:hypothetical protein